MTVPVARAQRPMWAWGLVDDKAGFVDVQYTEADGVTPVFDYTTRVQDDPELLGPQLGQFLFVVPCDPAGER